MPISLPEAGTFPERPGGASIAPRLSRGNISPLRLSVRPMYVAIPRLRSSELCSYWRGSWLLPACTTEPRAKASLLLYYSSIDDPGSLKLKPLTSWRVPSSTKRPDSILPPKVSWWPRLSEAHNLNVCVCPVTTAKSSRGKCLLLLGPESWSWERRIGIE